LYENVAWYFTDRKKRMLGIFGKRQMGRMFGLEEEKEDNMEI
jgi:hypothetical protein